LYRSKPEVIRSFLRNCIQILLHHAVEVLFGAFLKPQLAAGTAAESVNL
jgi:hypothetical protein